MESGLDDRGSWGWDHLIDDLPQVSTVCPTRTIGSSTVGALKAQSSRDVAVGGPTLAEHAIPAGLVDVYHLFVAPIVVGGGNPFLPDNTRMALELLDERGFNNGTVHLHCRART